MTAILRDTLALLAAIAILYGLWLIWEPLTWLAAGVAVLVVLARTGRVNDRNRR